MGKLGKALNFRDESFNVPWIIGLGLNRAGTGSIITGSGRARALRIGTGSGSGFTKLSPSPTGFGKY